MDVMAEAGSLTMLSYSGHENCSDCAYAALKQKSMSSARLRKNHLFIRNASSGRKFTFRDLFSLYHRAALLHREKIRKIRYAFIKDLQELPV